MKPRRAKRSPGRQLPEKKEAKNYRSMRGYVAWPMPKKDAITTFAFSKGGCAKRTEPRLQGLTMQEAGLTPMKCQIILRIFEPK